MSLEQALNECTAAIRDLINAMQSGVTPKNTPAQPKERDAMANSSTEQEADQPEKGQGEKIEDQVTYDNVRDMLLRVHQNFGREVTLDLLSKFGVAKGPDLKPEQYTNLVREADVMLTQAAELSA